MPSLEQTCRDLGLDPSRIDSAVRAFRAVMVTIANGHDQIPPALAAFLAELRPARPIAGLTHQQSQVLAYIREYQAARKGATPSYDQMAAHLGLKSKSGVHRMMTELKARGAVTWIPNHARSITVLQDSARNPAGPPLLQSTTQRAANRP